MWRPAADPGGVWPGAELRLGATQRCGRAAALQRAWFLRRCRGGGTAGPRDSSGAWRLRRARKRLGRRQAVVVKPLRGPLRFVVAFPWLPGGNCPEYLGGPPGTLTEDTR
ncbi:hypothetical protein NDU88_009628 [Pleurodeles waltl]|uniref:Uncharacterized protein n=1 Tax=Pleurodeles waltl TaxID=8319 RepID=A0AAV7RYZ2_PLEWA|nr:hypothetical protein NDU88_009628 [Pleurodeles waltl]